MVLSLFASTVTLVMIAAKNGRDVLGKIIVTGASGQFGNAAARLLLETGAGRGPRAALSRTPDNLAEFAEAGAHVRRADFDDPASLLPAMEGGERMLLISTVRVGTPRRAAHRRGRGGGGARA